MRETQEFLRQQFLMVIALAGLALGVGFWAFDRPAELAVTTFVVVGIVIAATAVDMIGDLMARHFGLDILAVIAMIATLAVEEYVAGLIVAVMLTGGEALEAWAARRATRELDTLLNRAPVFAQRIDPRSGDTRHASVVVPPDLDQGVRHTCVKDAHQGPHSPAD